MMTEKLQYYSSRTAYDDAYDGYWASDISKLNGQFGTSGELKDLSTELYRCGP
jgi:glycosidase